MNPPVSIRYGTFEYTSFSIWVLAFFVGNAAGRLVLSASIYMFGLTNLKPFARLGALTAFVNVVAAMLSILPDIGQPLRLWHMLMERSP